MLLWSLFRDNPHLAKALPALAAKVIQARVSAKYGLRVGVIAILHTFNGQLEFNSHVHTMVTGGGLYGSSDTWVSRVYYDRDRLMEAWRRAVIALLRAALRAGQLRTEMTVDQMEELLTQQEKSLVEHQDSILQVERAFPAIRRSVRKAATHCAASHHLHRGSEPSRFGTKTKSCVAGFTCSAHWKSSLTVGRNTFRNAISTLFAALGCLLRALSGKPRQPSLQFWDRSEDHAPNLALGRTP